jgi:outer membrane biosynthesis protein TonB
LLGERGFWSAVALVVVTHGAVLTQWRPAPWSVEAAPALPPIALTFRVRPLQPTPAPPVEAPSPPRAESNVASETQAPAPAPAPGTDTAAAPAAAPTVDPPYFPRSELTVPPAPIGPVDVRFPEDVTGIVNLKVQATLFIEEDGTVRRVRIDTPDIHPSFHGAVMEAFSSARFSPGQVEALPVRSQMRVEVEFQAPNVKKGP